MVKVKSLTEHRVPNKRFYLSLIWYICIDNKYCLKLQPKIMGYGHVNKSMFIKLKKATSS